MTPEERLKQAEILLATAAKTINRNSEGIEQLRITIAEMLGTINRNSEAIARNSEGIEQLRITTAEVLEMFSQWMRIMQKMQADIRGLQTENQRILRHLFGEQE